jgi:hypothetical protein
MEKLVSLREQLSALYDKFSCSDITARYDAAADNMTLLTETQVRNARPRDRAYKLYPCWELS